MEVASCFKRDGLAVGIKPKDMFALRVHKVITETSQYFSTLFSAVVICDFQSLAGIEFDHSPPQDQGPALQGALDFDPVILNRNDVSTSIQKPFDVLEVALRVEQCLPI